MKDIQKLYQKLLIASVAEDVKDHTWDTLFVKENEVPRLSEKEAVRLLEYASIEATKDDSDSRRTAYEVANRISKAVEKPNHAILLAADAIMAQLGFFQSQKLHRDRFKVPVDDLPFALALRGEAKREYNTYNLAGLDVTLSDFQQRVLREARRDGVFSFSAPTSAGKSFVLEKYLVDRVQRTRETIIYLVPTRALIRQVSATLRTEFGVPSEGPIVPVRTTPVALVDSAREHGAVYVLTPERLEALLLNNKVKMPVHAVIVDESQSIATPRRGIVLQGTLERLLRRDPAPQMLFASPLAGNPGILPKLLRAKKHSSHAEEISPVSQNFIIARRGASWEFHLLLDGKEHFLCRRAVKGPVPNSDAKRKAQLATHVHNEGECTIVYCNDANRTEEAAAALVEYLPSDFQPHPDVLEFIEYVREHVHPEFPLVDYLAQGIGVHYGTVPNFVRQRLEDLVKRGLIRFLCCTTTLLQGVNFPTRNIIMLSPMKGTLPMTPGEYRNLAGRAGRLGKDFHGNVWIINPSAKITELINAKPQQEIVPAQDAALRGNRTAILNLLKQLQEGKEIDVEVRDELGTVIGKLYHDIVFQSATAKDLLIDPVDDPQLRDIEKSIKALQDSIEVPEEVLRRNPYEFPGALDDLHDYLRETPNALEQMLPTAQNVERGFPYFEGLYKVLNKVIGKETNRKYRRDAFLTAAWLRGDQLRQLLNQDLAEWEGEQEAYEADNPQLFKDWTPERRAQQRKSGRRRQILDTIDYLEQRIRFVCVGRFRVFYDLAQEMLKERGDQELAEDLLPLHIHMECGTSDPVELALIGVGFSRLAASLLHENWNPDPSLEPEAYLKQLSSSVALPDIKVQFWQLPDEVLEEIFVLTGRRIKNLSPNSKGA